MPLYITNQEAEDLARELAAATGETITDAVLHALRDRLDRLRKRSHDERMARLREISDRAAAIIAGRPIDIDACTINPDYRSDRRQLGARGDTQSRTRPGTVPRSNSWRSTCGVAAPTVLETSIVLGKLAPKLTTILREFLREAEISIIAFDEIQLSAAEDAHRRFGRGAGHPARLNFGDCFAYAAAAITKRPLLFKGSDFAQTDVVSALAYADEGADRPLRLDVNPIALDEFVA